MIRPFLPVFILIICSAVCAESLRREIDLSGDWLIEIGDTIKYAERKFDDSKWATIKVPHHWENEGFPGYDGYAWYRKKVFIDENLKGRSLYLQLGRIDDADITYFNGQPVGKTGSFPPGFATAWNVKRIYPVPLASIRYGKENTIAVRVFDMADGGGIFNGQVGIYSPAQELQLLANLSGVWQFRTGDSMKWNKGIHDSDWTEITVPASWESQGFYEYDGIAWYRKTVTLSKELDNSKLILVLGKIDDRDEVYWNGSRIGSNGAPLTNASIEFCEQCYARERAYFIPPQLIKAGAPNVITIRVLDTHGNGGIYDGPVGITTRDEYLKYSTEKR